MKKLPAFLTAILLLTGCTVDREQPMNTEASFPQSTMTRKRWTDTDGTTLDDWLYSPENPAEDMPPIVYLHGNSGKEDDLQKSWTKAVFLPIFDPGSFPRRPMC